MSMSAMGKEASLEGLEFDGETVLCRVCGDRASGFHYGVHACEGCKGFFRRSIQQKIQYRPCLKNQQCNIQRVNRNRCQYCRLKKCISVGMSRDAVRFGRVPKKEKARIIEQMHKKSALSQAGELSTLLANGLDVVHAVVASHRHTCDLTQMRAAQMREHALNTQQYVNCPSNMACPLNNELGLDSNANRGGGGGNCGSSSGTSGGEGGGGSGITDFSESFTPAIKSVVDFAKGIPGFVLLNQDDQVTLLKAGTFEVLLVRFACLFDPQTNTMMFTGGKLYQRQASSTVTTNAGFLLDSMFDFAERFNKMYLLDEEIALFSAVVLMSPDRPGLRNVEQVERIQSKLSDALQNMTNANHREDPTLFTKLIMKRQDLRTLNTLHSEKSIARQRANHERRERQAVEDCDMDFQDSLSTRSGRSSPSLSEGSNMTMTSGYSGETGDSGSAVVGQRLPLEASSHQQVVLRTPYGTFFREEMSGFYGMMSDQPRRRCNTLDRDTLTRPRLHTIEEGNRRRYTLDRDYINKMVNRLSDRLEPHEAGIIPTAASMSSSTTSSPIQEEGSAAALRGAAGSTSSGYSSCGSAGGGGFTPISLPDGSQTPGSGGLQLPVSRTSPMAAGPSVNVHSTPGSPNSRSRSGSFSQQQEDYSMRPRCYSYHHNSEGRAARMSLQRRLLAAAAAAPPGSTPGSANGAGGQGEEEMVASGGHGHAPGKQGSLSSLAAAVSSGDGPYMSAEMRRGSVGTAYGLHNRKSSLLVDRPLSYIGRNSGGAGTSGTEMDKRAVATANAVAAAHGLPIMKHVMPDGSIYPLGLPPPPDVSGHAHNPHHSHHPHPHHPALWHPQAAAAAALAMGLNPGPHHGPHSLPPAHPMMQQQQRNFPGSEDGITRSASFSTPTSSSYHPSSGAEWDASAKQRSRGSLEGEQQMRDLKLPTTSKAGSPSARSPSSTISSADAAAMKAAAAAAQGNMMMSMMMIGRPLIDARNDPFIGHAFAAAAKERIGGRRSNNGESKGEAGDLPCTNGFSSSPSAVSSDSTSPNLPPPSSQPKSATSSPGTDTQNGNIPPISGAPTITSGSAAASDLSTSDNPRVKSTSPKTTSVSSGQAKTNSDRCSPMGDDNANLENFGHKKFDKFRKVEKVQASSEQVSSNPTQPSSATPKPATVEGNSVTVKEEKMEQEMEEGEEDDQLEDDDEDEQKLKVDLSGVKIERRSPGDTVDEEAEDADMSPIDDAEPSSQSPSPANSPSGLGGERPKLSAKEAHPNLLAHLMNGGSALKASPAPGQAAVGPSTKFTMGNPAGAPMGFPWNLSQHQMSASTLRHPFDQMLPQEQQMFKHPTFSARAQPGVCPAMPSGHSISSLSPSSTASQNQQRPDTQTSLALHESSHGRGSVSPSSMQQQEPSNKKEEFHAAAVSNLKDKILRKYDSMENLHKISKSDSASTSPTPSQPFLTSSQSSSALSSMVSSNSKGNSPPPPAPITGRSNSTGNTEGLNKELATKLTICSMASAETSRSSSPQDAVVNNARPNSLPSSSSQVRETAAMSAATSSAESSSSIAPHPPPGSLFSPGSGLPHPASPLSQIPQMLMSQGIHPANLPMYHSMLARGFPPPPSSSSSSSSSNTSTLGSTSDHLSQNAPLASMQRFADFFARGQIAEPGEKRRDFASPLNLTSRMDEGQRLSGSSSPSQSPQTPA